MRFSWILVGSLVAVGLSAVGCDDNEGTTETGGGGAGGSPMTGGGGTSDGGTGGTTASGGTGTGGSTPETGQLRVAHLSPGTPAVDVCVLPEGGEPIGPVLKSLGDTDGLAYPEVTGYLPLPAGTYGARIVAPNAADCTTALADLPDVTGIMVKGGGVYTAAATGVLIDPGATDKPFAIELYEDDLTVSTGNIRVRFIHGSPDTPAVDVGLGSGAMFTPVWQAVEFPEIGLVGGNAYVEVPPLDNATLSARATGTAVDALVIEGVSIPADSVVTAFAIGNLDGMPAPLKVRVCFDTKGECVTLP